MERFDDQSVLPRERWTEAHLVAARAAYEQLVGEHYYGSVNRAVGATRWRTLPEVEHMFDCMTVAP